jgi:hypothetical protein
MAIISCQPTAAEWFRFSTPSIERLMLTPPWCTVTEAR